MIDNEGRSYLLALFIESDELELASAFKEHTKRFKGKMSKPFPLPEAAWINKPENDKAVLL
jgi:hypothetical protein